MGLAPEVSLPYGAVTYSLYCGEKEAALVGPVPLQCTGIVPLHAVSFCFMLPQKQSGKGVFLCLPVASPLLILMIKMQYLHNISWNSVYLNVVVDQSPCDAGCTKNLLAAQKAS